MRAPGHVACHFQQFEAGWAPIAERPDIIVRQIAIDAAFDLPAFCTHADVFSHSDRAVRFDLNEAVKRQDFLAGMRRQNSQRQQCKNDSRQAS